MERDDYMERRINGICILPDNGFYALAYIPRNGKVMGFQRNNVSHREHVPITITLSSSYSALRTAVAIVEVLYTCTKPLRGLRSTSMDSRLLALPQARKFPSPK